MHHSTARKVIETLRPTGEQLQASLARAITWALPLPASTEDTLGFYAKTSLGYVRDSVCDLNEVEILNVDQLRQDIQDLYDARLLNAHNVAGGITRPIAPISADHVAVLTDAVALIQQDFAHNGYAG